MNSIGISTAPSQSVAESQNTDSQSTARKHQIDAATAQSFLQQFMAILNSIEFKCPQCGESTPLASGTGSPAGISSPLYASGMQLLGTWNGTSVGKNAGILPGLGSDLQGMDVEWTGGKDPSLWAETVHMSNARVEDGMVKWDETGNRAMWGDKDMGENTIVNANIWMIRESSPGKYEAGTFDYLRPNQMSKVTENIVEEGEPEPGERVGFLITGISRNPALANVQARSNIAWTRWPGEAIA